MDPYKRRIENLKAQIKAYGAHQGGCKRITHYECTCGFARVISNLDQPIDTEVWGDGIEGNRPTSDTTH